VVENLTNTAATHESAPPEAEWSDVIPIQQAAFFGDDNRLVKNIQRETYRALVFDLFTAARQRYLAACALVGINTDLADRVRGIERFERPMLRRVYRLIAKFYRFAFVGEQQTELPFHPRSEREQHRHLWETFFRHEADELAGDNAVATGMLRAVAHAGEAEGDAAEAHVVDLLAQLYGPFYLRRRLELLKIPFTEEELDGWRFADEVDWSQVVLDPRVRPDPPV
jgi:hypothetical protein